MERERERERDTKRDEGGKESQEEGVGGCIRASAWVVDVRRDIK